MTAAVGTVRVDAAGPERGDDGICGDIGGDPRDGKGDAEAAVGDEGLVFIDPEPFFKSS